MADKRRRSLSVLTRAGLGRFSFPNPLFLADVNPLAVACDLVGLIGVDGVCARAAVDGVLDGGNVPGLEEVVAATTVEVDHRGVALPDQVVRPGSAVDGIGSVPVA